MTPSHPPLKRIRRQSSGGRQRCKYRPQHRPDFYGAPRRPRLRKLTSEALVLDLLAANTICKHASNHPNTIDSCWYCRTECGARSSRRWRRRRHPISECVRGESGGASGANPPHSAAAARECSRDGPCYEQAATLGCLWAEVFAASFAMFSRASAACSWEGYALPGRRFPSVVPASCLMPSVSRSSGPS
jgi:hypothetical protein